MVKLIMSKLSKSVNLAVITALIVSIAASTYLYLVKKDFYIIYDIECDPGKENCYVTEDNDSNLFYSVIKFESKNNIMGCDITDSNCLEEICLLHECQISNCDDSVYLHKFDHCSLI